MLRLVPRPLAAIGAGLLVAGIVLAILDADIAAFAVAGLGAILLVAAAFYAVGRSEDIDRERQSRSGRSG